MWLFESFVLLPGCTDQGSGGMHKLPLNLGHFHPKDSHLFLALFPSYTRLKIITQSGKKTKRGFLRTSAFIPPSPRYRRFTVSWVTVKVAWVTFWLSFKNFLWISYWCYAKYFCTTKSGSFSPNHTNFYLIFSSQLK